MGLASTAPHSSQAIFTIHPAGAANHRIRYSDHHIGQGAPFFAKGAAVPASRTIVSKRLDAPYRPGRGNTCMTIKAIGREKLVVIG
jgi:hypothetical protein